MPPAAESFAPKPPASGAWGLRPTDPQSSPPPLRISACAPVHICTNQTVACWSKSFPKKKKKFVEQHSPILVLSLLLFFLSQTLASTDTYSSLQLLYSNQQKLFFLIEFSTREKHNQAAFTWATFSCEKRHFALFRSQLFFLFNLKTEKGKMPILATKRATYTHDFV